MPNQPRQCAATTKKGSRCRQPALKGKETCSRHTPATKVGRPSAFSDLVAQAIIDALRVGASVTDAAERIGISDRTVHLWIRQGENDYESGNGETDKATFFRDVMRARADARVSALKAVRGHMDLDWRAGAWILERTAPEHYGRTDRLAVTAQVEQTGRPDLSKLSDSELAQMETLLLKASGDLDGDTIEGTAIEVAAGTD